MNTAINPMATWGARYSKEVENSIEYYNWLNKKQPVRTRQMTQYELEMLNKDPNFIKQLEVNVDEGDVH